MQTCTLPLNSALICKQIKIQSNGFVLVDCPFIEKRESDQITGALSTVQKQEGHRRWGPPVCRCSVGSESGALRKPPRRDPSPLHPPVFTNLGTCPCPGGPASTREASVEQGPPERSPLAADAALSSRREKKTFSSHAGLEMQPLGAQGSRGPLLVAPGLGADPAGFSTEGSLGRGIRPPGESRCCHPP